MNIVVFGATGRVGRLVVSQALERGHTVTATYRNKHPFNEQPGLRLVKADVNDPSSIATAVAGHDAVVSTLGSWGAPNKVVMQKGMEAIIPAMDAADITRLVTLTGTGAWLPGEKHNFLARMEYRAFGRAAPKIQQDGEAHLRLLIESDLDWSSLRSPVMNNQGDAAAYKIIMRHPRPLSSINRLSVASAILDMVEAGTFVKQAPFIKRT